ncbi:MAG: hypothetical protein WKH64_05830 [Chloroflexia bacterium]
MVHTTLTLTHQTIHELAQGVPPAMLGMAPSSSGATIAMPAFLDRLYKLAEIRHAEPWRVEAALSISAPGYLKNPRPRDNAARGGRRA